MSNSPFLGSRSARQAHEAKSILDTAEDAGRDLTADERDRVNGLIEDARVNRELEEEMSNLGRDLGAPELVPDSPFALSTLSPGERFVRCENYKSIRTNRGENWSSGLVDVDPVGLSMKGHPPGGRRQPRLRFGRRSGCVAAGRAGGRRQAVRAARAREPAAVRAGDREHGSATRSRAPRHRAPRASLRAA
jgi:hypothetical protein